MPHLKEFDTASGSVFLFLHLDDSFHGCYSRMVFPIALWFIMSAMKRDSAMANLPWPPWATRSSSHTTASTSMAPAPVQDMGGTTHVGTSDDTSMLPDDIGDEFFHPTAPAANPPTYASIAPETQHYAHSTDFMIVPVPAAPPPWSYNDP